MLPHAHASIQDLTPRLPRLAWFTPWPPDTTGVAGRSAELVPALVAAGYAIDVFIDERRVEPPSRHDDGGPQPGQSRVIGAHDFVWRRRRGHYDLAVYQVGNSRWHEFIWPYLFQFPGLAVLHDARLHHARGRALLARGHAEAYRAEFRWNHPTLSPDLAELAVEGLDGPHFYQWPMTRAVVAASRAVGTHALGALNDLRATVPDATVEYVALGEGLETPPSPERSASARQAFHLPAGDTLIGLFGGLTAEKRVPEILDALATVSEGSGPWHLVLGGHADPSLELDGRLARLGLLSRTTRLVLPDDTAFDLAIAAVDVSLNLRWPTALETSGPWVRALAAGKPTVIVDLAHQSHVPTLDPRTWLPHASLARASSAPPVAVAVDILDEAHSLRRAFRRLISDRELREALGREARRYWVAHHRLGLMVRDYDRLVGTLCVTPAEAPPDRAEVPGHLRPNPFDHARGLTAEMGLRLPAELDRR